MSNNIELIGLKGIPLIEKGDNLSTTIINAIKNNGIEIENGDILVIAQSIISKSLGLIKNLNTVRVSNTANEIYKEISSKAKKYKISPKSPELIQLILDESKDIIKKEHVLIVETKHGFICANAGIDKSNVDGKYNVTLLPENPDREAEKIRNEISSFVDKEIAVIISDSFGRPFRIGAVGVALGASGINPILDKRGFKDLYGYKLQSTVIGQIDNLASAAQLIMGETDEGLPVVIIKGYKFEFMENMPTKSILRNKEIDLFIKENKSSVISDLLKKRRSYKLDFSEKHVEKKVIEQCIDIARWAPSAHNKQSWRYIIIEKGRKRENLIKMMNRKLREDLIKDNKPEQFIRKKIEKTKKNFINAPYLILICLDRKGLEQYSESERTQNEFIMGIQSVSASTIYFLLAVESKGLASCWYCAPLFTKEVIKETFNLPSSYFPAAFITVGYPSKKPKIPQRKELNEIIFEI